MGEAMAVPAVRLVPWVAVCLAVSASVAGCTSKTKASDATNPPDAADCNQWAPVTWQSNTAVEQAYTSELTGCISPSGQEMYLFNSADSAVVWVVDKPNAARDLSSETPSPLVTAFRSAVPASAAGGLTLEPGSAITIAADLNSLELGLDGKVEAAFLGLFVLNGVITDEVKNAENGVESEVFGGDATRAKAIIDCGQSLYQHATDIFQAPNARAQLAAELETTETGSQCATDLRKAEQSRAGETVPVTFSSAAIQTDLDEHSELFDSALDAVKDFGERLLAGR
jgi:hypothetical protein